MENTNNYGRPLSTFRNSAMYGFPKEKDLPAGRYKATLDWIVESETTSGDLGIEACYTLTDEHGASHKIKQRISTKTQYINVFLDSLEMIGADTTQIRTCEGLNVSLTIDLGYADNGYGQFEIVAPRKEFHPPKRKIKTLN